MKTKWNYPNFWRGKRVLVTGASGFIGGALVDMLVMVGAEVYVIGLGVDYHRSLYGDGIPVMGKPLAHLAERVIFCDITNLFQVGHAIKVADPEYIFHMAAVTQVTEAAGWPLHCFEVNTMGTLKLLEAARLTKPDTKIIISSSDKVYGHPPEHALPCHEETSYYVTHPYDASKAAAELIAQSYGYQHDMNVHIVRMSNVYGPGDTNWKRLIPGLIRWTFNHETPIIRSDGNQVRQYMYISDAIHGLTRIGMAMDDKFLTENCWHWNLGPDVNDFHSVQNIIVTTAKILGRDWNVWMREPKILGEATDECPKLIIDSTEAENMLEWKASTPIDKGIRLTAEWFVQLANREYLVK